MAKFVIALVCLTVIQASLALKCKRCADPGPCTKLEDETCPGATGNNEAACLTFIWKDGDKVMTEKKCVTHQKSAKYECTKSKTTDVQEKCDLCDKDLCNEKSAAPKIGFGALSIAAAVFAIIAHKIL